MANDGAGRVGRGERSLDGSELAEWFCENIRQSGNKS